MWWLLAPVAYLLGGFPSADLVARASGVDIYASGSGNPGASNVTRTLGWRKGLAVFGLDALKGVIAAATGLILGGRAGCFVLGTAAVVGHIFPATRRLRGGKGVAAAAGVMLVWYPVVLLATAGLWLIVARLGRKAGLASLLAVVANPAGVAISGAPGWEVAATGALAGLLVARHTGNIRRMLRHEEPDLAAQPSRARAE